MNSEKKRRKVREIACGLYHAAINYYWYINVDTFKHFMLMYG